MVDHGRSVARVGSGLRRKMLLYMTYDRADFTHERNDQHCPVYSQYPTRTACTCPSLAS
jgi:hypothetical protein